MSSDAAPDNALVGFFRSTGMFEINVPKNIRIGDMRWGARSQILNEYTTRKFLFACAQVRRCERCRWRL